MSLPGMIALRAAKGCKAARCTAAKCCTAARCTVAVMLLAVMAMMASCVHKELCYTHPHMLKLRLEFNWRDAELADPDGMCVFFYPEDGGEYRRFDFTGRVGGEIEIEAGRYRVLCYNNDTETVVFAGMNNFSTHKVMSYETDILSPLGYSSPSYVPRAGEDEKVVKSPEMMWGCTALDVDISEHGITYTCVSRNDSRGWMQEAVKRDERVITLYPHELVCEYTLEVRNVKNLKYATQISGILTGLSPELLLHDETTGPIPVTLPYECRIEGDKILAQFYTFGHNTELPDPHCVVLYIWMTDGKIHCFGIDNERFDVTQQVHTAPDRRHVHLIIDGLELPETDGIGGGGMTPTVDDWGEVIESILM